MTKYKIFACSDIHGHYKEMIDALNKAGFDENKDNHLLIVLGDIFDRGSESLLVYKYLKKLTDKNKAIVLRGNHDTMFIEYLDGTSLSPFNYLHNGTNETFADFLHCTAPFESWCLIEMNANIITNGDFVNWLGVARKQINTEYPELYDWLIHRPFYYETKNYIFTHGAIDTEVEDWHIPKCTKFGCIGWEALTWDDGSFFGKSIKNTDKTIVIGHFGTEHLRNKYRIPQARHIGSQFDILKRKDGRVIAIDGTTVASKKVNVLVIDDEEV